MLIEGSFGGKDCVMQKLFLVCDKCHFEVEVEPLKTFEYRSISCKHCDAELVFQNSELKARDVADLSNKSDSP